MASSARALEKTEHARRARVLVIDDEPMFGRSLALAMGDEMEIVAAVGGRDGLARLDADDTYDAILCDLMMPGTTGMDVHERLASRPSLQKRMIFMTGGTYTDRARRFLAGVTNPRLEKPFDVAELRDVVRSVVESNPTE